MELNEDGLIPGQAVDFETVMRLSRKAKAEQSAPVEQVVDDEEKPRRGRKPKASDESEQ